MTCKSALLKLGVALVFCSLGVHGARAWQADNGDGTFKNPVLYADYPDPDIIRVNTDFYMVSTTFLDMPGINVLQSKGLVSPVLVTANGTQPAPQCTISWSNVQQQIDGFGFSSAGVAP